MSNEEFAPQRSSPTYPTALSPPPLPRTRSPMRSTARATLPSSSGSADSLSPAPSATPSLSPSPTHTGTHLLPPASPLDLTTTFGAGGVTLVRKASARTVTSVRPVREASAVFAEAKALYLAGEAEARRKGGNVEPGRSLFKQAKAVFLEIGEAARADKCEWQVGMLHAKSGLRHRKARRWVPALQELLNARTAFRQVADLAKEGMALFQIGLVRRAQGEPQLAQASVEEALRTFTLAGEACASEQAMSHCELGSLSEKADPQGAIHHFQLAATLFRMSAERKHEARAHLTVGRLASKSKLAQIAESHLQLAVILFGSLNERANQASAHYALGKIAAHESRLAFAVEQLSNAAELFGALGMHDDEGWSLYRLGLVMHKSEDAGLSVAYMDDARRSFAKAGNRRDEAACLLRIGEQIQRLDKHLAMDPLAEALMLFESVRDEEGRARAEDALLETLENGTESHRPLKKQISHPKALIKLDKENVEVAQEEPKKRKSIWIIGK